MSVTFGVVGFILPPEEEAKYNFTNVNAARLLLFLGYQPFKDGLTGEISAYELRHRIEDFLTEPEPEPYDGGSDGLGPHARAQKLLELCIKAGDKGRIYYS